MANAVDIKDKTIEEILREYSTSACHIRICVRERKCGAHLTIVVAGPLMPFELLQRKGKAVARLENGVLLIDAVPNMKCVTERLAVAVLSRARMEGAVKCGADIKVTIDYSARSIVLLNAGRKAFHIGRDDEIWNYYPIMTLLPYELSKSSVRA